MEWRYLLYENDSKVQIITWFVSVYGRLTRTRGIVHERDRAAVRLAAEVRVWREYVGRVARGRPRRCGAGATVRLDSACHTAYRPLASPAALIRRRRARHCEKTFNNSFFIILTEDLYDQCPRDNDSPRPDKKCRGSRWAPLTSKKWVEKKQSIF